MNGDAGEGVGRAGAGRACVEGSRPVELEAALLVVVYAARLLAALASMSNKV